MMDKKIMDKIKKSSGCESESDINFAISLFQQKLKEKLLKGKVVGLGKGNTIKPVIRIGTSNKTFYSEGLALNHREIVSGHVSFEINKKLKSEMRRLVETTNQKYEYVNK